MAAVTINTATVTIILNINTATVTIILNINTATVTITTCTHIAAVSGTRPAVSRRSPRRISTTP
jgi:hypothetical protein